MKKEKAVFACGISFKPHYAFKYMYRVDGGGRSQQMPIRNAALGELSVKAKRRITTAMNWMIYYSKNDSSYSKTDKRYYKFKINFITLTLSGMQKHSDQYITRHLLQPFLKWLQRKGASMYLWKAEVQDNGNLHYHITTNKFIEWRSIRNKWNDLQYNHGYLKDFFTVHGHFDPNSTDVHSVKNPKTIVSYMVKYLTKGDLYKKKNSQSCELNNHFYMKDNYNVSDDGKHFKRAVNCHIWNCSNVLTSTKINIKEEEIGWNKINETVLSRAEIKRTDHGDLLLYKDGKIFGEVYEMIKSNSTANAN